MPDPFWTHIAEQYEALKSARTVDEVLTICPPVMSYGSKTAEDGFWEGGGGDLNVFDALLEAGWRCVRYVASYYWVMRAPAGRPLLLTYIEGDLCRGDRIGAKANAQN